MFGKGTGKFLSELLLKGMLIIAFVAILYLSIVFDSAVGGFLSLVLFMIITTLVRD